MIESKQYGDVTVVTFTKPKIMDEINIQAFANQLYKLVDEDEGSKLLLNFDGVKYVSSSALGKLVTLNKKINEIKGQLVLWGMDPDVYEVFAISRLDQSLRIDTDDSGGVEGALSRMNS